MAQLEVKKMKQGMSYSSKEKTIILNVFKYFRIQFPDKCVTDLVRRTAKATGCSEKSIFQFRKEEASAEGFKEPSKTKIRKNININSRDIKYDNNVRQAIRCIIYELKNRNIVPSLNTILKHVNGDARLPNFSLMTLRRLLFDMGFYYEKNGNKSILVDKTDVKYLNKDIETAKTNLKKPPVPNHAITVPPMNKSMEVKSVPNVAETSTNMQMGHMYGPPLQDQQRPRLMPMHVMQSESHMMPSMHTPHGMQMMLNSRRDLMQHPHASHHSLPPSMDVHMKRDIPPWMHPTHDMVKEQ